METKEVNNVEMTLGALVRPRDKEEDKYSRLLMAIPPSIADLSQVRTLVKDGCDPRPVVFNQGGMGSCSSCGGSKAVEATHNFLRCKNSDTPNSNPINPAPMYWESRKLHGWADQDIGSYVADNLDLLLTRSPLLTDGAYSDDYRRDWSGFPWHSEVDYELQHQPFYPGDGNTLEHIWSAIDRGCAVVQAGYWAQQFFYPSKGKLQEGVTDYLQSGHAFYVWGIVPGYVLCANSWSSGWSPDAEQFGFGMRPGDFAIPWSYYGANTPWWEYRVISPEPVPDEPNPVFVSFDGVITKANSNKVVVRPNNDLLTNIAGKQIRATFAEGSFNGKCKTMEADWVVLKPTVWNPTWDIVGEPIHVETI